MSFELRITFSGLCMFVPGKDAEAGRMHVLMPATGAHDHGGHAAAGEQPVEQHVLRLAYDAVHEQTSPGAPTRKPVFVELAGSALSVPHDGRPSADPAVPPSVVDLFRVTEDKIDPALVRGAPAGHVAARVSMGAGAVSDVAEGAVWELDGRDEEMSHAVQWVVPEVPGDSLTWDVAGAGGRFRTLHPVRQGSRQVLELYIFNIPPRELPAEVPPMSGAIPTLPPGYPAWHFLAYYDLFDHPKRRPVPRFKHGPRGKASGLQSLRVGLQGVTTYTCVPAQSGLKP
jgi:hypothetical protein